LRGLWDTQKRSTDTASSANSNIGKLIFSATTSLNSTPCASVSFSSAPNIFVCIIYIIAIIVAIMILFFNVFYIAAANKDIGC